MEKKQINSVISNYLFIAFVDDKTILSTKEKYVLVALDDGGTCILPKVFLRTSKANQNYISLPKDFKTTYRYTEYNRETKERKLITQKEITSWDVKKLLKNTNDRIRKEQENLPF